MIHDLSNAESNDEYDISLSDDNGDESETIAYESDENLDLNAETEPDSYNQA